MSQTTPITPILAQLPFPTIDPVAICLGPLALRWYALAYIAGIILGWWLARRITDKPHDPIGRACMDTAANAVVIGVIVGGRLGYVLFYNLPFYLENPLAILMVWQGGMSFHGGLLGVVLAVIWSARRHQKSILALGDVVASVVPIGLFFGRVANFINAELYGRFTDMPWGVVFRRPAYADGDICTNTGIIWQALPPALPRHPSQLYEAGLEGIVLFALLMFILYRGGRARPGLIFGTFLLGYGVARGFVEFFRLPDAHIGYLLGGLTMGQVLCLPMIIVGVGLIRYALRQPKTAPKNTP